MGETVKFSLSLDEDGALTEGIFDKSIVSAFSMLGEGGKTFCSFACPAQKS